MNGKPFLLFSGLSENEPKKDELHPSEENSLPQAIWAFLGTVGVWIIIIAIIFIHSCIDSKIAHAEEFSNNKIVNAIRKAEGTPTYGIKSIPCTSEENCRRICLNTVKRNRKKYHLSQRRGSEDFLVYLQRIYCPIGKGNDPKGLNRNWLKNVEFYLAKG